MGVTLVSGRDLSKLISKYFLYKSRKLVNQRVIGAKNNFLLGGIQYFVTKCKAKRISRISENFFQFRFKRIFLKNGKEK